MEKIYAICKTLDAGYDYEKKQMSESNINIGDKIELLNAKVDSWTTDIYLKGYKDSFNSVFFDFVDESGNSVDIYHDVRFRSYM